jgi:Uma2 family endonuclease
LIATAPRAVPPPAGTPLPRGIDLPSSDGEPMESLWHVRSMHLLIDSIESHRRDRTDFFAGGDMFFYFSPEMVRNHDFRGPDFFVVNDVVRDRERRSWVAWEEGWRLPNVIVELASESTAHIDRGAKQVLYTDRLAIPEYVIVDPDGWRLEGWRRYNGTAEPMELENGRLWLRELEAHIGFWHGTYGGFTTTWPRLFDVRGNLIPTEREREQARADAETQRADAMVAEIARLKAELAARGGTP